MRTRLPSISATRFAIFAVVVVLPDPLQSDHENGCRRVCDPQSAILVLAARKHGDQFVMNDFDNLVARGHGSHDRLTRRLALRRSDEALDHRQRNVRFQQGQPYLAERGGDVGLRQNALARELVKNAG